MLERLPPYRISRTIDRFARKIWFTPRCWFPAVIVRATADIARLKVACSARGVSINAALLKAMAMALAEFPRLNYYTVRGRMVWGGSKTSVSIVVEEEPYEACHQVRIEDAEAKTLEEIQREIAAGRAAPVGPIRISQRLMNLFPRTMFFWKKITGRIGQDVVAHNGVVVLTNINTPQIDEMVTAAVYFTMILCPGTIREGKMPLTLSFNHELANARPVAAYLARVKEILESADL